jgi:tetratricopeptide (TPR) repeat protein
MPNDTLLELKKIMKREEWKEACAFFEDIESNAELDFEMLWSIGWIYFKLDELDKSAYYLEEAVALDPSSSRGNCSLGIVLRKLGRSRAAEGYIKKALSIKDSLIARNALAILYKEAGRIDEGELVLRRGLELRPGSKSRITSLANYLWDIGKESEASVLYKQAEVAD